VMALQATRPIQMAFDRLRRFTADASHELRTPLAVIQTQTDVILAAPPRDEAALRRAFEPIQRSGKKMAGLVADLLFLARSDASSVEIQAIPLDFDELVEDVVEDHAAIARNKGISLTFEGDRVPLKGDPQRLQQLVTNLIENALKYTDRGEVRVRLTRANGHPHGLLQVSDTGPGIEAKHLPHVFGRFYRTNAARSSDKPGTGLGLAIVKAIALAHKGSVSVESEPGKGSTFSVRLPLA